MPKDHLYIFVLSLTIAFSLNYFNLSEIPWLLLFLISFSILIPLWLLCKKLHSFIHYKIKRKKEEEFKNYKIRRLIDTAFIGMDVKYKMEALNIIKKYPSSSYSQYEFIVKKPYRFIYNHLYDYENPFYIRTQDGYMPLLFVNEQHGYYTMTLHPLFYDLIIKNSNEIIIEYNKLKIKW